LRSSEKPTPGNKYYASRHISDSLHSGNCFTLLPIHPISAGKWTQFERFFEQLFINRISAFFGMDVVVSSLALWTFVWVEGSRLKMKNLWDIHRQ
jgi:hypothetical protein